MGSVFRSIRRTPYQSLGSFLIIFFTLFSALFFFNMTSFFHGMLTHVSTLPQVIAYFDTDAEEPDILALKDELESSGQVKTVIYVSQEEALGIYKEANSDNPRLLEMVSANILPASLEVNASKPEYLDGIAEQLEGNELIDDIGYQEIVVDRLVTLTTILRRVSIGLFAFLIFISIVILLTTTAFKIAVKREEISLMQLIGASKWYVRKPFVLEGMTFGVISATIAFIIYYGFYLYFQPFLFSYMTGIPRLSFYGLANYNLFVFPPSLEYLALSYGFVLLFGVLIGLIGNFIATSKYIK